MKRKAAGKPVKAAEREEKPDNVVSLMDALKQSLKGEGGGEARPLHRTPRHAHRAAGEEDAALDGQAPQGGLIVMPSDSSLPGWSSRAHAGSIRRCDRSACIDPRTKGILHPEKTA